MSEVRVTLHPSYMAELRRAERAETALADAEAKLAKACDLLRRAYSEARRDPEICTMELAGGGNCWCRQVRAVVDDAR